MQQQANAALSVVPPPPLRSPDERLDAVASESPSAASSTLIQTHSTETPPPFLSETTLDCHTLAPLHSAGMVESYSYNEGTDQQHDVKQVNASILSTSSFEQHMHSQCDLTEYPNALTTTSLASKLFHQDISSGMFAEEYTVHGESQKNALSCMLWNTPYISTGHSSEAGNLSFPASLSSGMLFTDGKVSAALNEAASNPTPYDTNCAPSSRPTFPSMHSSSVSGQTHNSSDLLTLHSSRRLSSTSTSSSTTSLCPAFHVPSTSSHNVIGGFNASCGTTPETLANMVSSESTSKKQDSDARQHGDDEKLMRFTATHIRDSTTTATGLLTDDNIQQFQSSNYYSNDLSTSAASIEESCNKKQHVTAFPTTLFPKHISSLLVDTRSAPDDELLPDTRVDANSLAFESPTTSANCPTEVYMNNAFLEGLPSAPSAWHFDENAVVATGNYEGSPMDNQQQLRKVATWRGIMAGDMSQCCTNLLYTSSPLTASGPTSLLGLPCVASEMLAESLIPSFSNIPSSALSLSPEKKVRPAKKAPRNRVKEFLAPAPSRRKSRAGRKPLSGVFGICRQDSRWVVSYRDNQERSRHRYFFFQTELEQWTQLVLAKRFLWKVVRLGRKLNPRDGEGLEEFVRSYDSDGTSEFLGVERAIPAASPWTKDGTTSAVNCPVINAGTHNQDHTLHTQSALRENTSGYLYESTKNGCTASNVAATIPNEAALSDSNMQLQTSGNSQNLEASQHSSTLLGYGTDMSTANDQNGADVTRQLSSSGQGKPQACLSSTPLTGSSSFCEKLVQRRPGKRAAHCPLVQNTTGVTRRRVNPLTASGSAHQRQPAKAKLAAATAAHLRLVHSSAVFDEAATSANDTQIVSNSKISSVAGEHADDGVGEHHQGETPGSVTSGFAAADTNKPMHFSPNSTFKAFSSQTNPFEQCHVSLLTSHSSGVNVLPLAMNQPDPASWRGYVTENELHPSDWRQNYQEAQYGVLPQPVETCRRIDAGVKVNFCNVPQSSTISVNNALTEHQMQASQTCFTEAESRSDSGSGSTNTSSTTFLGSSLIPTSSASSQSTQPSTSFSYSTSASEQQNQQQPQEASAWWLERSANHNLIGFPVARSDFPPSAQNETQTDVPLQRQDVQNSEANDWQHPTKLPNAFHSDSSAMLEPSKNSSRAPDPWAVSGCRSEAGNLALSGCSQPSTFLVSPPSPWWAVRSPKGIEIPGATASAITAGNGPILHHTAPQPLNLIPHPALFPQPQQEYGWLPSAISKQSVSDPTLKMFQHYQVPFGDTQSILGTVEVGMQQFLSDDSNRPPIDNPSSVLKTGDYPTDYNYIDPSTNAAAAALHSNGLNCWPQSVVSPPMFAEPLPDTAAAMTIGAATDISSIPAQCPFFVGHDDPAVELFHSHQDAYSQDVVASRHWGEVAESGIWAATSQHVASPHMPSNITVNRKSFTLPPLTTQQLEEPAADTSAPVKNKEPFSQSSDVYPIARCKRIVKSELLARLGTMRCRYRKVTLRYITPLGRIRYLNVDRFTRVKRASRPYVCIGSYTLPFYPTSQISALPELSQPMTELERGSASEIPTVDNQKNMSHPTSSDYEPIKG